MPDTPPDPSYIKTQIPVFNVIGDGVQTVFVLDLNKWPFNVAFNQVGIDRATATLKDNGPPPKPDVALGCEVVSNGVVKLTLPNPIPWNMERTITITVQLHIPDHV